MTPPPAITVAIPTVCRPEQLRAAIASVAAQTQIDLETVEVIVIDNSADGYAAWVRTDGVAHGLHLVYVHETVRGFARVRNAAVAHARGAVLVFLDDDETASANWLSDLIGTLESTGADAAFGPVLTSLGPGVQRRAMPRGFLDRMFGRNLALPEGADLRARHMHLGTGNSAFRIRTCFEGAAPFDEATNALGGEDTLFLRKLVRAGRRLVWSPRAVVTEYVPLERCSPAALRERRFRQGQMRSMACRANRPPDWPGLAFWMAAGAVQGALHSAAVPALFAMGRPNAARLSRIKAMGGWGKLAWWWTPEPAEPAADAPLTAQPAAAVAGDDPALRSDLKISAKIV